MFTTNPLTPDEAQANNDELTAFLTDPLAFNAWLIAHGTDEVGQPDKCKTCPVANYVREHFFTLVPYSSVAADGLTAWVSGEGRVKLYLGIEPHKYAPNGYHYRVLAEAEVEWIGEFTYLFDCRKGHRWVSGNGALREFRRVLKDR